MKTDNPVISTMSAVETQTEYKQFITDLKGKMENWELLPTPRRREILDEFHDQLFEMIDNGVEEWEEIDDEELMRKLREESRKACEDWQAEEKSKIA
jgi:DNA repair ATPase RecN